jgi:LmbE family N-acetylglucosaminyl deacetylase
MWTPSRRKFLGTVVAGLHGFRQGASLPPGTPPGQRLQVVCVGAHPDDPESGCGGTLARYAALGHRVTIVYLTRGERGIPGKTLAEAAAIRTNEAERACEIIGATPVFAGQIDGATELNGDEVYRFARLLDAERPDIAFTHWPLDTHMDHQVASLLTFRAALALNNRFPVFFFEVDSGDQTRGFLPTDYVDISTVRETKKRALFAHVSQDGEGIYRNHHELMEAFRGREAGCAAAEAFVRLSQPLGPLPLVRGA